VHERGVQVPDLPLRAARLGVGRRGRTLLDQRPDVGLGRLPEHVEGAVAPLVLGDLGRGQPAAVDVLEQVVLRADLRVHELAADSGLHQGCSFGSVTEPTVCADPRQAPTEYPSAVEGLAWLVRLGVRTSRWFWLAWLVGLAVVVPVTAAAYEQVV